MHHQPECGRPATHGVFGDLDLPLAFGLLRLCTDGRPERGEAIARIHQALDAGIRILDTADSYARDDGERHYGEALAAQALASWHGPREAVRIVTKLGMVRPKGRWLPNGKPAHLRQAIDGSLRALGVEQVFLLLLHGVDPSCPFEDTLGTLAELRAAGKVAHLGLCNVDLAEIAQAERHFPVAAIQNELSVVNRKAAADGTLAYARAHGIAFLAHRPLGGHAKTDTLTKNRAMQPVADHHRISRHEAALATLLDLGPPLVPVVGATRAESLASSLRAATVRLTDGDRAAVAAKIHFEPSDEARALLQAPDRPPPAGLGSAQEPGVDEVVLVMGIQGAGKSTRVQPYLDAGYQRLNRDLLGGSLDDLLPLLREHLAAGRRRVVLDNTYPTRASRWPVLRTAWAAGVPVRGIHLATPAEAAQFNIALRLLQRYGRLPGPDELKELSREDPNLPPPLALARHAACHEPPAPDEGYAVLETVPFVRQPTAALSGSARALFLDVDGTLRRTKSGEIYPRDPEDIEILPGRRERLSEAVAEGYELFLVSNQSGIASGQITAATAEACFTRTIDLLGVPVADVAYCPHPAFPVGCFCRKPMPGLGVQLAVRHGLSLRDSRMVGDLDSDRAFAAALGCAYSDADAYFG